MLPTDGEWVIAYLVACHFSLTIYSTVLSILLAAIGVSSALGAFILSCTLRVRDSFNGFLTFAGIAAVLGGALLLLLSRQPTVAETEDNQSIPAPHPLPGSTPPSHG